MEGRETAPTNCIDIHSHGKLRMTIDEIGGWNGKGGEGNCWGRPGILKGNWIDPRGRNASTSSMESLRLGVDGFKLNGEQHVQSFSKEQMGGDAGGRGGARWYSSAKTCLVHETMDMRHISGSLSLWDILANFWMHFQAELVGSRIEKIGITQVWNWLRRRRQRNWRQVRRNGGRRC